MKNQYRIVKIFASVSGLIILNKIIGFVKQMIVASTFGATVETDLINLSQNAVSDIQYILSQALITAIISMYIHIQQADDASLKNSHAFAGDSINAFALLSVGLTVVMMFFSGVLAKVLAPSYSYELRMRLSHYLRIYSTLILLFTLNCIFIAILSANKNFIPEQLVNFNTSVITIAVVLVFSYVLGEKSLVVSCFAYTIWNTVFLGIICRKHIKIYARNPSKNPDVIQLFKMVVPLLLGYSLIYVNQMVDRMLVTGLGAGVITSLSYASVLSNLITAFITTFCSIIFSYITSEISARNYKAASNIVSLSVKLLSCVFMPISLTFVICSHEIVSIVYGRGAFDANAVSSAALALKGYAVMFVPVILREVYSRFQYAFQDTKKPMINGSIGIIGNIILSIILCRILGVYGVALATSISVIISAVCNMFTAKDKTKDLSYLYLPGFALKLFVSTVTSVLCAKYLHSFMMMQSEIVRLLCVFLCCCMVFFILFYRDVHQMIQALKNFHLEKSRNEAQSVEDRV